MIIESLIIHILGDFYMIKDPSKIYGTTPTGDELNHHIRRYSWISLLLFLLILFAMPEVDFVLTAAIIMSVVMVNTIHKVFIMPLIQRLVRYTSSSEEVLTKLVQKNRSLVVLSISQLLQLIWIFFISEGLTGVRQSIHWIIIGIGFILITMYLYQTKKQFELKKMALLFFSSLVVSTATLYVIQRLVTGSMTHSEAEFFFTWDTSYYHTFISYTLTLLLLMKPANLLIRKISSAYNPKLESDNISRLSPKEDQQRAGFKGAGAMIGTLERILILLSFSAGQLLPIVAILSIKAFARYKRIVEEASFSEYFVIGTLLSVSVTFLLYLMLQSLITAGY